MEVRIARTIRNIETIEELAQFEANARRRKVLTDGIKDAIRVRSAELGRVLISERTGLDLSNLSPAEEKIVQAASEYVGVMKRKGKDATRTLMQLRNRGLIEAAEAAVSKSVPTQGFRTLAEANLAELSYEQIVLDHQDEFSPRAVWFARRTLGLPNDTPKPPANAISLAQQRTETLLQWLRDKSQSNGGRLPSFTNSEAAAFLGMTDLHQFGRVFGNIQSRIDFACYASGLPPLGLAADASFDQAWGQQDRDWAFPVERMKAAARSRIWSVTDFDLLLRATERLPGQAHISWKKELATNEEHVKAWAYGFGTSVRQTASLSDEIGPSAYREEPNAIQVNRNSRRGPLDDGPYWVFVCNPKKWAIDRFLDRRTERDTWGVRPSDRDKFAPGQLGIIRVGLDRRTIAERNGKPPLEPGIYALCEVESEAFDGSGADADFWAPDQVRAPGWPTIKIRYLRTYHGRPLTIERLRVEKPNISKLLLTGFQASSFPISGSDFREVMAVLGDDLDNLPAPEEPSAVTSDKLAAIEERYLRATPEVKERLSKTIERGPVGALVKRVTGFKCQLCEALGLSSAGFLKKNGEPYIEAHHVMPVSKKEVGSLAASNVMTLCANHHRQMHYGRIEVTISATTFDCVVEGSSVSIPRISLGTQATVQSSTSSSEFGLAGS